MKKNGTENTKQTPGAEAPAPRLVERVTALRGLSISRQRKRKSTLRQRTRAAIFEKDAEVPYVKYEAALQDLVCSLMERQDRMNEEIFYRMADLEYRVGDLEAEQEAGSGEGP